MREQDSLRQRELMRFQALVEGHPGEDPFRLYRRRYPAASRSPAAWK